MYYHWNTFSYFKIHYNTFQIHCNIFKKPWTPLTHVITPFPYSNTLPYTFMYVKKCLAISIFLTFLFWHFILLQSYYGALLYKNVQNCCGISSLYRNIMALAMMNFWESKEWCIFHESHKSYWLVRCLNPQLILWEIINYL
jgi:hypothetical protein